MKSCKTCGIDIKDPVLVCPLCHSVLEETKKEDVPSTRMYPDIKDVSRKLNFIVKLYVFLALVVEGILFFINYQTYSGLWWSGISGIALVYFFITLRYSIQKNSGYLRVILLQILLGVAVVVAIDYILGYKGWSVNFVFPGAILLINLTAIILMLINTEYWQSYILLQLLTILMSIGLLILWKIGLLYFVFFAYLTLAISVVFFVGTLIFGDRAARNELKRRFHV